MTVSRESFHDDQLVRYLLGLLPDDEAERLDQLSVSSDEVAWRLRVAEDDLVDAYVRGTLDAEAVDVRIVLPLVRAPPPEGEVRPDFRRRRRWESPGQPFAAPRDGSAFEGGLGTCGGRLDPSACRRYAERISAAAHRAVRRAKRERRTINRASELERQLKDERQAGAGTARELESIRTRDFAPGASPSPPAIALVLLPQTRSVGPIATIAVLDGSNLVALELQLESNGFARYQAVLRDPGTNRIVWRRDKIAARAGDRMPTVALSIPAGVLRSQHYSLELNGTNASGEAEVAGSYVFQVVRR